MRISEWRRILPIGVCALALGLWSTGCERDTGDHLEDAGESLKDAGESLGDAIEQGAEDAGDAIDDATD